MLLLFLLTLSSEHSEFGRRVLGQLTTQDETNKIMLNAISGLNQTIEILNNKLQLREKEAPNSPNSFSKSSNYSSTVPVGKVGNSSFDMNDGLVGNFGTKFCQQNRLQELFIQQYQKSRETIEAVRAESNFFSTLRELQQFNFR